MLTECLGDGPAAAVVRVTAAYDVDEGVLGRDVGDLLDGLRLKRLLAPAGGLRPLVRPLGGIRGRGVSALPAPGHGADPGRCRGPGSTASRSCAPPRRVLSGGRWP